VRGVTFDMSFPRLAAARVAGFFSTGGFVAPFGPVRLRELPDPKPPSDAKNGDEWVVVAPTVTGVCGSDVKQIFLDADVDNPLRALISFPHVLGHEVAARVLEVGRAVWRVRPGDRVAVSPWLPCEVRGHPKCGYCASGDLSLCDNFTSGPFADGIHAGNCRDVPGGYGDRMIAHESMCFSIPDGVTDEEAALSDPFSVAVHAIRKAPPKPGETVLVYGCGPLGLLTIHALSGLYPDVRVVAVDLHDYLEPHARAMGAHDWVSGEGAELVEKVAELTASRVRRVRFALPWVVGGVDRVYDTVGVAETLETAVRLVKPLGTLVLVGVGTPRRYEWTPIFFREITVIGSNAYGVEDFPSSPESGGAPKTRRMHGFEHYLGLLAQRRLDPTRMITHRFPLDRYREAFVAARDKRRHSAVKVVFVQGE
jgi:threonine dehydrogenase-like Zn-dependent dehydrogenase